MSNPIENALKAGRSSERSLAGVRIRILREDSTSKFMTATVAQTEFYEQLADASGMSYRTRDYCIDTDMYIIGGYKTEPAVGDVIIEIVNGQERRFECLSLDGEQAYTWMDRSRFVYRVHTKEVASDYTTD